MGLAILLVALMRRVQLRIALVSLVVGVLGDGVGALPVVHDLRLGDCGPLLRTLVRRDRHGVVGHLALLAACLRGSTRARDGRSARRPHAMARWLSKPIGACKRHALRVPTSTMSPRPEVTTNPASSPPSPQQSERAWEPCALPVAAFQLTHRPARGAVAAIALREP